jgi:uncharacterized protein YPO0396
MNDGMLDFVADDNEAGFRLDRIEVYNWGTFDGRVTTLRLDGLNTLLTGENGSGKSTFIDALTTLLVPAGRVAYNRAAGADSRERDLKSYVLGHYRSEYNEQTGASKPVALRGAKSYSVILGVFHNRGFDQTITLAQVFWPAETGQPNRRFVTAEGELSIDPTFTNFSKGVRELTAQLRAAGADVHDAFAPYGAWFRRRLGIQSEQALDLFHQTVSMKAVGNLTEFVRAHMLDIEAPKPRIDALVAHFDDLTRAHASVLRAKRQVNLLAPLLDDCERYADENAERATLASDRDRLKQHFALEKVALLDGAIDGLRQQLRKIFAAIERRRTERAKSREEEDALRVAIRSNGGDELRRIADEIALLEAERTGRRQAADRFAAVAETAGFTAPETEDGFIALQERVKLERAAQAASDAELRDRVTDDSVVLKDLRRDHATVSAEIDNLQSQRGNIPREQVELRARLCSDLGLDETTVPFAGELVRVADGEARWEGAAERLLRNFALSLLIPDDHYVAVQRWVDERHLRAKVVYYRVPATVRRTDDELHRSALFHKLELRTDLDRRVQNWLEAELRRRAGVVCCDTPEQFQRERSAITAAGQIKGGNDRHEKDDRWRIDDRARYVLGWSNDSKIATLRAQAAGFEGRIQEAALRLAATEAERRTHTDRVSALGQLSMADDFRAIDWRRTVAEIAAREEQRAALLAASDQLRALETQLAAAEQRSAAAEQAFQDVNTEAARVETTINGLDDERIDLAALIDEFAETLHDAERGRLAERAAPLAAGQLRKTSQLTEIESKVRDQLTAEIDAATKRIARLVENIVRQMQTFRHEFPAETTEIDVAVEASPAYGELLRQLRADDLPRFEAHFAELLTENTLREIANFQAHLHKERAEIGERVDKINASLETIEYNATPNGGRYIALVIEASRDLEVRQFQNDLRACTEGTFTGTADPGFAEAKFLQVRAIIDRFKGRPDVADADRRWTAKVTDVRNWCTFAASERWRADNVEYEHYSDSAGKSGGQKEKLAYTVLAASLAYQFGLELGEIRSRSFRFVAIDEAFGRADTEATQFGLELFAKFHLQLLVVTPLQRISIIEPYVRRVGYVSRVDERSRIANLTIEEYRKRKDER